MKKKELPGASGGVGRIVRGYSTAPFESSIAMWVAVEITAPATQPGARLPAIQPSLPGSVWPNIRPHLPPREAPSVTTVKQ